MKLVIDTNILVSAFLSDGLPRRLLKICITHHHTLCSSEILIQELLMVLGRPPIGRLLKTSEATELLELYREQAEIVTDIPFVEACRDPKDDVVIATAMAAKARFVITGDKDLISLRQYEGVWFLTAKEFLGLGDD